MESSNNEEIEQKGSNKTFFIIAGLVIIVAIAMFMMRNVEVKPVIEEYNGYTFEYVNTQWVTTILVNDRPISFGRRFSPQQTLDVPIQGQLDPTFFRDFVVMTHDPAETGLQYVNVATLDTSLALSRILNVTPIAACTINSTAACADRPIVTCENTDAPVIYIKEAENTLIDLKGNCAIIQGNGSEIVRAADRAMYGWLGIIE